MLPHALGAPRGRGQLKRSPEDFQVDEVLGFEPSGEGEHYLVQVRKRGLNTADVARELARHAGVAAAAVSWSGMKDRQALTSQWFGVHIPGREVDWSGFSLPGCELLSWGRQLRKLRTGSHVANRFLIRLRAVEADRSDSEWRLEQLTLRGAPNYFGEQRFGRAGNNLAAAQRWFAGGRAPRRNERGLLLSAARSEVFNRVLAQRVCDGSWEQALPGEVLILDGRGSLFLATGDEQERLQRGEVHPTGPLPGEAGALQVQAEVAELEAAVLAEHAALCEGLCRQRVSAARRALRLWPRDLEWAWEGEDLRLSFTLARGCFATSLVRELMNTDQVGASGRSSQE